MYQTTSRPSLLTRISDVKSQSATIDYRSYRERPREESFVERYRGTEFESPAPVLMARDEHISRGRSFVIIGGTAALSMIGMLLVAAAG